MGKESEPTVGSRRGKDMKEGRKELREGGLPFVSSARCGYSSFVSNDDKVWRKSKTLIGPEGKTDLDHGFSNKHESHGTPGNAGVGGCVPL